MRDAHSSDTARQTFITHVTELNEKEVLDLVQKRVAQGDDPLTIIEDCQEGLRQVGERYERQEYFLSGLIMAGEIFREVMEIVQPIIVETLSGKETGIVLLGTVRGDIHDIGKNNLSMLLTCYGFSVHDLGVDVPPSEFLLKAFQVRPNIIGLSGLLTSSYDAMKETIELIRMTGDPDVKDVPIVIGGNQLNEQVCKYVGADYWLNDAMSGVRLCQKLLSSATHL